VCLGKLQAVRIKLVPPASVSIFCPLVYVRAAIKVWPVLLRESVVMATGSGNPIRSHVGTVIIAEPPPAIELIVAATNETRKIIVVFIKLQG
jgi:hypothetical protein